VQLLPYIRDCVNAEVSTPTLPTLWDTRIDGGGIETFVWSAVEKVLLACLCPSLEAVASAIECLNQIPTDILYMDSAKRIITPQWIRRVSMFTRNFLSWIPIVISVSATTAISLEASFEELILVTIRLIEKFEFTLHDAVITYADINVEYIREFLECRLSESSPVSMYGIDVESLGDSPSLIAEDIMHSHKLSFSNLLRLFSLKKGMLAVL
jgi:hypothetical protein